MSTMAQDIAARRLAAARERLAAAKVLLASHPADAITRAYRAMTSLARAALATEGVTATDEDDLFTRFRLYYGRGGGGEAGWVGALAEARAAAHAVDEEDGVEDAPGKAARLVTAATRLLEEVGGWIERKAAEEKDGAGKTSPTGPLPPEKTQMLADLAKAFDGDKDLIARYLTTYGWGKVVAANVRAVRHAAAAEAKASGRAVVEPEPDADGRISPFYPVRIRCYFCGGDEFETFLLRGKAMQLDFDYPDAAAPLLVPSCGGAQRNYREADPVLHEVHVCPFCLYASPNLGNFKSDEPYVEEKGILKRLARRKLDHLAERYEARRDDRVRRLEETLGLAPGEAAARRFGAERDAAAARLAFRFAAEAAEVEGEYNGNALLSGAKGLLAAARLARDAGDETEERALWGEALGMLERALERTSRPGEAIYLTARILALLHRTQEARLHLSRLLTARGKYPDASRFRRFAENLNEDLKRADGAE